MDRRTVIFLNSVAFVLGFTVVFSLVGVLLQTALANVAYDAMSTLRIAGGLIITAFGVLLIAALKYRIPFLSSQHSIRARKFSNSYVSSFVFGTAFAMGWTPCVSFILGAIYVLAATSPGIGFLLLLAYSLGIGVPFLLVGLFTSRISTILEKGQGMLKYFNIIGGLLLVAIGLLVLFNYLGIIAGIFVGAELSVGASQLSFFAAFLAGLVTFFSPCILPLVPAFLSYMAGTIALEAKK